MLHELNYLKDMLEIELQPTFAWDSLVYVRISLLLAKKTLEKAFCLESVSVTSKQLECWTS